jgi:catalase-peroxidase
LEPVKHKHGNGLSWGDLFALAGTVAIEHMGGPVLGFCAGRIDMIDNSQTRLLGPTPEQEKWANCDVQGDCKFPLGQNTLGLIYVNPEGPMGQPDPHGAAETVRDVFGRMDWKGKELVALIGGGHAFGKAHGATTNSPGDPPDTCPYAPWAGATGTLAVTSGFEGAWTAHPTKWDNDYFKYLDEFDFEPIVGPGGHHQWRVKRGGGPQSPSADPTSKKKHDIMMLTTDVALATDEEYKQYVHEFAKDIKALEKQFAYVWYKLVTRDVGPASRCLGPHVPEPQSFQVPLPPPHRSQFQTDYGKVEDYLKNIMTLYPDERWIDLAWQCASTYRATDHQGGCNGARIRFAPGNTWPINKGLDQTLDRLESVKRKFGNGLSWADLIVLAGSMALHLEGADAMEFCPGRVDATDGSGWDLLSYGIETEPKTVDQMIEVYERRGQTAKELVALTWRFFKSTMHLGQVLLNTTYTSEDNVLEQGLKFYPELRVWAEYYVAKGDNVYRADFADAWTKVMNADRFDGPIGNLCYDMDDDDAS